MKTPKNDYGISAIAVRKNKYSTIQQQEENYRKEYALSQYINHYYERYPDEKPADFKPFEIKENYGDYLSYRRGIKNNSITDTVRKYFYKVRQSYRNSFNKIQPPPIRKGIADKSYEKKGNIANRAFTNMAITAFIGAGLSLGSQRLYNTTKNAYTGVMDRIFTDSYHSTTGEVLIDNLKDTFYNDNFQSFNTGSEPTFQGPLTETQTSEDKLISNWLKKPIVEEKIKPLEKLAKEAEWNNRIKEDIKYRKAIHGEDETFGEFVANTAYQTIEYGIAGAEGLWRVRKNGISGIINNIADVNAKWTPEVEQSSFESQFLPVIKKGDYAKPSEEEEFIMNKGFYEYFNEFDEEFADALPYSVEMKKRNKEEIETWKAIDISRRRRYEYTKELKNDNAGTSTFPITEPTPSEEFELKERQNKAIFDIQKAQSQERFMGEPINEKTTEILKENLNKANAEIAALNKRKVDYIKYREEELKNEMKDFYESEKLIDEQHEETIGEINYKLKNGPAVDRVVLNEAYEHEIKYYEKELKKREFREKKAREEALERISNKERTEYMKLRESESLAFRKETINEIEKIVKKIENEKISKEEWDKYLEGWENQYRKIVRKTKQVIGNELASEAVLNYALQRLPTILHTPVATGVRSAQLYSLLTEIKKELATEEQ